jgi:hypothetical protein
MGMSRSSLPVWVSVRSSNSSSSVREHHQRPRQVREPELAHEEVVELERQPRREVWVRALLVGEADVEADGPTAGLQGAPVRRFHDAAAPAGADDEPLVAGEGLRPEGQQARQLARLVVVATERASAGDPGRPEEDDGVMDPFPAEPAERLQVLGQDPDGPGVVAVEESGVVVRDRRHSPAMLHGRGQF